VVNTTQKLSDYSYTPPPLHKWKQAVSRTCPLNKIYYCSISKERRPQNNP